MISEEKYFSIEIKAIWIQLRKEPLFFWFFCGYLFFEYVRPQSIYPVLNFLPWTKLCVIGALIGSFLSNEEVPSAAPLAKYYWGLLFSVFLSSTFAEFPGVSFIDWNVMLNWLIIYYLFIRIVNTKFRFFIVTLLIMLASYKMSQHAAITWAKRGFAFARWGVAGPPGYFGNAADLGVQMLISLPLAITLLKCCHRYWGKIKKLFFCLFPITVIMAIIATGERNTLVGLAAICLAFLLFTNKHIKSLLILVVFVAGLYLVMPQEIIDRFKVAGSDGTSVARLTYWKRGLEMFESNKILGIGFRNWGPYYLKYWPGESLRATHQEAAHSTPVTILAELGLLGLFFYYGLFLKTIHLNLKSIKLTASGGIWRDFALALNLGLVGFLAASIFITVSFYPFLFIHASLSAALYNLNSSRESLAEISCV